MDDEVVAHRIKTVLSTSSLIEVSRGRGVWQKHIELAGQRITALLEKPLHVSRTYRFAPVARWREIGQIIGSDSRHLVRRSWLLSFLQRPDVDNPSECGPGYNGCWLLLHSDAGGTCGWDRPQERRHCSEYSLTVCRLKRTERRHDGLDSRYIGILFVWSCH
jgi:hypothetical protein